MISLALGKVPFPDASTEVIAKIVPPIVETPSSFNVAGCIATGDTAFEEEKLGGVMFVPLVGAQGWAEDGG